MKLRIRTVDQGFTVLELDLERLPALLAYGGVSNSAIAIGFMPGTELELEAVGKTMTIREIYTVPELDDDDGIIPPPPKELF